MTAAPAVDLPALRDRLGDDPELLAEVLAGFLEQLDLLRVPLAGDDPDALRTAAHTLAGMALTVGAGPLAEAAHRLGAAARAGAPLAAARAELAAAADAAAAAARAAL